jgi:hypothetical protein
MPSQHQNGFECTSDVHGTWRRNSHHGARVDMGANDYAYRFSATLRQAWQLSEPLSLQPEIQSNLSHVADSSDLRRVACHQCNATRRRRADKQARRYDRDVDQWGADGAPDRRAGHAPTGIRARRSTGIRLDPLRWTFEMIRGANPVLGGPLLATRTCAASSILGSAPVRSCDASPELRPNRELFTAPLWGSLPPNPVGNLCAAA